MANKIDPSLGYNVTTRNLSYEQMVREAWGTEWGEREVIYEFSNGSTRVDTNNTKLGIYGIAIYNGIIIDSIPQASEMYSTILFESGDRLGIDE